ncbi:MAG: hypothetical protein ACK55Z_10915, partial [bacterium]
SSGMCFASRMRAHEGRERGRNMLARWHAGIQACVRPPYHPISEDAPLRDSMFGRKARRDPRISPLAAPPALALNRRTTDGSYRL